MSSVRSLAPAHSAGVARVDNNDVNTESTLETERTDDYWVRDW